MKKYEFTGETKTFLGRELRRISLGDRVGEAQANRRGQ